MSGVLAVNGDPEKDIPESKLAAFRISRERLTK
jgi:hypothetical protein